MKMTTTYNAIQILNMKAIYSYRFTIESTLHVQFTLYFINGHYTNQFSYLQNIEKDSECYWYGSVHNGTGTRVETLNGIGKYLGMDVEGAMRSAEG